MTYDPTVPGPAQRISDTQLPIQTNFEFIESGDSSFKPQAINHDNRTPLAIPTDPVAIANAYIMYCKDDNAGSPELFGIDENSVISQFTSTDRVLAQTGYALMAPGFLLQWGRNFISGGLGSVIVTFPKVFSATAFIVNTTPYGNPITGSSPREWGARNITDIDFEAIAWNGTVPGGGIDFGWLALGPA